jgi:hypothetical protein
VLSTTFPIILFQKRLRSALYAVRKSSKSLALVFTKILRESGNDNIISSKTTSIILNSAITTAIDAYIDTNFFGDHTGNWWRLRDTKTRFLKLFRDKRSCPGAHSLRYAINSIQNVLNGLNLPEFEHLNDVKLLDVGQTFDATCCMKKKAIAA